jgi:hypothetical protein
MGIVSHKTEKKINLFQLKFENKPTLRWVEATDPRLSQSLMDEFLILRNNKKTNIQCNSNNSKLTCINKRRTYGIVLNFRPGNLFLQKKLIFLKGDQFFLWNYYKFC